MAWYLRKNSLHASQLFNVLIPLALGFGVYVSIIPALILAIFWRLHNSDQGLITKQINQLIFEPQFLMFFLLLGLFFGCYWMFYLPYNPSFYSLPGKFFPLLTSVSLLPSIWGLGLKGDKQYIDLI